MTSLLVSRCFGPLFATQFLGALNDNFFKNAVLVFILYRLAAAAGIDGGILMPVGAGIFVLPFFLFSATAGQLADRFDKARLIRVTKGAEVVFMACGAAALLANSIAGMMGVLFLMGTQASFFGPLKYAILPEQLAEHQLVAGNGLIEAGTFLAILIGTIAGGLLVMAGDGPTVTAIAMIGIAMLGWAFSWAVPSTGKCSPDLVVGFNVLRETRQILRYAATKRPVFLSVLGISWFWLVGAVFLAEFPAFAKDVIGGDEHLVTLFMTLFSIGIAIGSVWCGRLLKGEVSAKYVPLAAIGIAVFAFDLWSSTRGLSHGTGALLSVGDFLGNLSGWHVVADLLLLSVCGGIYGVPLYATLQAMTEESHRARVIAANNVMNAAFMVAGSVIVAVMLAAGLSIPDIFLAVAVGTAFVAAIICKLLPRELFCSVAAWLFRRLYRVEVLGLEKLRAVNGPMVIVANHVSWLDGPLMAAFIPGDTAFAINSFVFTKWWGRLSKVFAHIIPVDPTNPMSTKSMIRAVEDGKRLIIFPEGRLTVTGSLMKVYDGPGVIADKAKATLVPVKIDGTQLCRLNRLEGKMPLKTFPKITISVQDPVNLRIPAELKGRARRRIAAQHLYDVMSTMMFQTRSTDVTLFEGLLEARRVHGGAKGIVEDIETITRPLSYDRLVFGSLMLGRTIARLSRPGEYLGVLLPNAAGTVVTLFALQSQGRVPAMLNFSSGAENMLSACRAAEIRTILTSRRFIGKARLEDSLARLAAETRVIYLEDVKAQAGRLAAVLVAAMDLPLLGASFTALFSRLALARWRLSRRVAQGPDTPAVALFTSGSEGKPKGVILSHRNLLANIAQLGARVDFNPADKVFNALPIFHSFGLTGGLLLPVLSGIKTFVYPSPLHYRIVPELAYDTNATVMFGTNTFLAGYAKHANVYDFYSVRYIFAGAERVEDETRRVCFEKFGLRILEGYGATETAPVIAVNTPMYFRAGTVGRILPGIDFRLAAVPGVDDGQRLIVKGPNVMMGYLKDDAPGVLQPPADGWYDTGDIVALDADGFLRIVGRAKRFVKIAGDMVSLGAVEAAAAAVWPGCAHAAVGVADPKKGEQIILLTDQPQATRASLLAYAKEKGLSELMVPKTVQPVDRLPLLGTGKIDYPAVLALAQQDWGPATNRNSPEEDAHA